MKTKHQPHPSINPSSTHAILSNSPSVHDDADGHPQLPSIASASASRQPKQRSTRSIVFLTVSFYLLAALVMVFVNKWVLNSIPIPIFLLFCQLAIAVILLRLTNLLGFITLPNHPSLLKNLLPPWIISPSPNNTINHHHHHHHHHHHQSKPLRSTLPLALINTLGLVFNTYCLKFVDASFYQVARGLILPFTVLASYLFLGTRSSTNINLSIFIVSTGFIVGVCSERLTVSGLGVILGILSSITTSIHAIVVKRSLERVPSTILLTYYTNALSAIIVLPLIFLSGETQVILQLFSSGLHQLKTFLVGTLITGLFGFLICLAGFLSIKVTSPITHMISSAVRGVIQTALGAVLFGDQITGGRIGGIALILIGSIYYSWIKDQELMKKESSSKELNPDLHQDQDQETEMDKLINDDGQLHDDDLNQFNTPNSVIVNFDRHHQPQD